jgi:putative selenate reductase
MSDEMKVQPFDVLLEWILKELEGNESIFGIHRSLFYTPKADAPYASEMFGQYLATPVGPAAGPHTQLTQNIISAWLSGGRFIELKTVQIMDELEIPRPCIDMEDEGYNVEWSQELKLDQSAWEYVKAWVLLRVLRRLLGFEGTPFGTIFNMSVGYNLEGILTDPMQRFMDRMEDASEEVAELQAVLHRRFPGFADIEIPSRLTNSVTLSTMHGCPPDEIEKIGQYLLADKKLHTIVKLNPTLLGKETVLRILHNDLGYTEIDIPDAVFAHDLQYGRAVALIEALKQTATESGLFFGVKLSNTLAMANHRGALPGNEMYMSGRALYPVTMNLFHKLVQEFGGDLNVSYSAGADALNVSTILASGALPVTAASDLLKPGGYSRLRQYLENLEAEMGERGAASLEQLAADRMTALEEAAAGALAEPRYKKRYHSFGLPKVDSALAAFDCVTAPCVEQCAICQDVPEYAWLIAEGDYDRALEVILNRNPLPGVTGYVCTHLCQTCCTRNNYDEPVAIRDLKRFATEYGKLAAWGPAGETATPAGKQAPKVAIIGTGPAGLAAAYFLGLNGVKSILFESREMPGGMLAIAPHFRLPPSVVQADIERITALGAEIQLSHRINTPPAELLAEGFEAVYVATGFQEDATLALEGIDGEGVFTALRFLEQVARGERPELGDKVLVIGGGNTAMDAARTAQRLTGKPSTVVYRRTQAEMPAEEEELRDLFDEGNRLIELASPERVILRDGHMAALACVRNRLGKPGADGRRRPERIEGSEFELEASAVILAIGQKPDIAFLADSGVTFARSGAIETDLDTRRTAVDCVYAGGDVTRSPAIIIQACEDGRRAAADILQSLGIGDTGPVRPAAMPSLSGEEILQVKRARANKTAKNEPDLLPVDRRAGFDLVELTLSDDAARAEAARCLQCSTLCDKCVEVCPNRANYTYYVDPVSWTLPLLACRNGELKVTGDEAFQVEQARQIIHVDDFCNECGNCATFCVHQGKPYADKPRLFLKEADFSLESDNAFYVQNGTIRRREGGQESRLTAKNGDFSFENEELRVEIALDGESASWEVRESDLLRKFEGEFSLREAAEMAVILQGVRTSLAFL